MCKQFGVNYTWRFWVQLGVVDNSEMRYRGAWNNLENIKGYNIFEASQGGHENIFSYSTLDMHVNTMA